jgi:hypothetical protein
VHGKTDAELTAEEKGKPAATKKTTTARASAG